MRRYYAREGFSYYSVSGRVPHSAMSKVIDFQTLVLGRTSDWSNETAFRRQLQQHALWIAQPPQLK